MIVQLSLCNYTADYYASPELLKPEIVEMLIFCLYKGYTFGQLHHLSQIFLNGTSQAGKNQINTVQT